VPPEEHAAFQEFLAQVGYPYWDESDNPAYHCFLGHRMRVTDRMV
jgi:threonine dehydratase